MLEDAGDRDVFIHQYDLNNLNHKLLKTFTRSTCGNYIYANKSKKDLKNVKIHVK